MINRGTIWHSIGVTRVGLRPPFVTPSVTLIVCLTKLVVTFLWSFNY